MKRKREATTPTWLNKGQVQLITVNEAEEIV